MDIQKWLDETVLPEQPPSPPDHGSLPPLFQPREIGQTHRGKRRREHSTSDSSLLDIRPQRKRTSPIEDVADVEKNACSEASHPASQSSRSNKSSKKYARRPRHKTRPDRYKATANEIKKRGTHTHRLRKGETKKTKRKSKSKNAEKLGTGIIQSFQAKNVPNDRLTLKPRDKLGIFNKGRASSPVKGRGLPDLVFSEMRFLQKHRGQPEAIPQTGLSKKRLKKDHAHAREEEISAYFTTVRPALAEQGVNTQAKEGSQEKDLTQELDHERDGSAGVDNAIPTIEMPDKAPYLGIGSRGPRHESGSYISWSESNRAPSAMPMIPRTEPAINVSQLNTNNSIREGRDTNGRDMLQPKATPPPAIRNATDGSSGCYNMYSHVSRSHSLPEHISSPRHMNHIEQVRKIRTTETVESPSLMPPSISHRDVPVEQRRRYTHVDGASHSITLLDPPEKSKLVHPRRDLAETETDYKETDDADPPTSSSLGKILQDCNTTFNQRRRASASYEPNRFPIAPPSRRLIQRELNNFGSYRAPQTISTVRFAGVESYRPILSISLGPGIYEQQEQRQQHMQQPDLENYGFIQKPYAGETDDLGEEGEMNYDVPERADETWAYGFEPDELEGSLAGPYKMEHEKQRQDQSNDVVARGFWRPHKLY